jgi:Zn-dependent protease
MAPSAVLAQIAIFAVPVLAAIIFHEVAHGAVAYTLGDPTAARLGRLTLNPLPHIDPVGTVLLPGILLVTSILFRTPPFIFGWAKPVPVDFRRLRHPRRDTMLVALAGPGTNLILAAVSAAALGALPRAHAPGSLVYTLQVMAAASIQINCVLAVFNLFPIPPLDGSRVLTAILPAPAAAALGRLERWGFVIVILLVMNTRILPTLVHPLVALFFGWAR